MSKNLIIAEKWLMGNAFINSTIPDNVEYLCDTIGSRWSGTQNETSTINFILKTFKRFKYTSIKKQGYNLKSWTINKSNIFIFDNSKIILDSKLCLFFPNLNIKTKLIDINYGSSHHIINNKKLLKNNVVLLKNEQEPFCEPESLAYKLKVLAETEVKCVLFYDNYFFGRFTKHFSSNDWVNSEPYNLEIPLIQTSREDGNYLSNKLKKNNCDININVKSEYFRKKSYNIIANLKGVFNTDDTIVLGAHHDTTFDSLGANDNASGLSVLLETARLLKQLKLETGISPGINIEFATFGGEEQALQGSKYYVEEYIKRKKPLFMVNLDELSTGNMKGMILQFPELHKLVSKELNEMNEGLKCHILSYIDTSGDMYSFTREGIPSSILWRWRFVGRRNESYYTHSPSDTFDKINFRDLKEYAGFLSRILLRLSLIEPSKWPLNKMSAEKIMERANAEKYIFKKTM